MENERVNEARNPNVTDMSYKLLGNMYMVDDVLSSILETLCKGGLNKEERKEPGCLLENQELLGITMEVIKEKSLRIKELIGG